MWSTEEVAMKIRRLDPSAVSAHSGDALVSLAESDLEGISGAGCSYPHQTGGPHGPIIIATHYSYVADGGGGASAHIGGHQKI